MAQATYDTFNREPKSKFAGSNIYSRRNLFSQVGLAKPNPYTYTPTKYLYATSEIKVPTAFILKPIPIDAWSKQSNWIGFVAVATDEGKTALGRRDIVVAWRGSVRNVLLSLENLHLIRVTNVPDIVPTLPPEGYYSEVGQGLVIDTRFSNFLKFPECYDIWHSLEAHLHGVAGTQGSKGGFHLEVDRSIALVNKMLDALKDEYPVPASWWCMRNKGMKRLADGSWELKDHGKDDHKP
ncbi:hypothetical protein AAG906_040303 [Vitis piasezkii]